MTARAVPLRLLLTLTMAAIAAWLAEWARVPLPWMIGPLLATAAAGIGGLPLFASTRLRNVGQWAIGVALGLYFTPEVMSMVLTLAPAIVAGALWALMLGYGFHRLLAHFNPAEAPATTLFSAAIGGASEMAILAEQQGARVDRVAAAHSLRVVIVVVAIPLALQWSGVHGLDPAGTVLRELRPGGLALLVALTLGGVALLQRTAMANPWLLGALIVSGGLTAAGIELSALPQSVTNAGQLFIGVSLGARFTPDFARTAPRWLGTVAAGTIGMLALAAAFSWLLAMVVELPPATLLLGNSPGGIAEMCITAKVLQLGVPAVTAIHVVRYLAVLLLTPVVFRWESGRIRTRAELRRAKK